MEKTDKKDELIADLKQIIFKQKSDIENIRFENAQRDIKFLKEMELYAIKAFDQRDTASYQMLIAMISDWIHELSKN